MTSNDDSRTDVDQMLVDGDAIAGDNKAYHEMAHVAKMSHDQSVASEGENSEENSRTCDQKKSEIDDVYVDGETVR